MSCNIFKGIINFNDKPIRVIKEEEEMKTSKEMQLRILDKMRENVEGDKLLFDGIYRKPQDEKYIVKALWENSFEAAEYGIFPKTITINGVEIPKPLEIKDIDTAGNYYFPQCHEKMYGTLKGLSILEYNVFYPYATEEEAIQASKALFGIEE